MKALRITLLFVFLVSVGHPVGAIMTAKASTPQMPEGLVLVAKVKGKAMMTANGTTTELKSDDRVLPTATVSTRENATVVLVFSNGTTVYLGEGSRLVLDEFSQDPFSAKFKFSELMEEPSVSRLRLRLDIGELVADVKRGKSDSTFAVVTPAGSVGVRGTSFQLVFRPFADGRPYSVLRTLAGVTVLRAKRDVGLAVPAGQEVESSYSNGSFVPGPITTIPAGSQQRITSILKEMAVAVDGAGVR